MHGAFSRGPACRSRRGRARIFEERKYSSGLRARGKRKKKKKASSRSLPPLDPQSISGSTGPPTNRPLIPAVHWRGGGANARKKDLKSPFSIELYFSLRLLRMVYSLCLYEDMMLWKLLIPPPPLSSPPASSSASTADTPGRTLTASPGRSSSTPCPGTKTFKKFFVEYFRLFFVPGFNQHCDERLRRSRRRLPGRGHHRAPGP